MERSDAQFTGSYEDIVRIAEAQLSEREALMPDATREFPTAWYFSAQSKRYLETRNDEDMLFGAQQFLVAKDDGHVMFLMPLDSLDTALAAHEAGFGHNALDLEVLAVSNADAAIDALMNFELRYCVAESAHGAVWRIPRTYDRALLTRRLRRLSVTFYNACSFRQYDVLLELRSTRPFDFVLHPVVGRQMKEYLRLIELPADEVPPTD